MHVLYDAGCLRKWSTSGAIDDTMTGRNNRVYIHVSHNNDASVLFFSLKGKSTEMGMIMTAAESCVKLDYT